MRDKSTFRFKKFTIKQGQSTMKVGTDGVLLGAWATVLEAQNILDVGTGSGVIALMLAQRTAPNVKIDAVEISATDALQAEENFRQSPWQDRLTVHNMPLQQLTTAKRYDLIVSNPPYFINSLKPPELLREQARHTLTLTHTDLINAAARLLQPHGCLSIILPLQEGLQFIHTILMRGFYCVRRTDFRTKENKPVERLLLEFAFNDQPTKHTTLTLYDAAGNWSPEYRELTHAFYLNA